MKKVVISNKVHTEVIELLEKNFEALEGPMGKLFIKAVRLSFPDQIKPEDSLQDISDHLNSYSSDQLHSLINKNIKFICLAGFMKILSKDFIRNFKGKILNIHPSLLPKYKGLNTHHRAIQNKEKYSGCTVHLVNSKLDSGKIILQKKVKLSKKETPSSLQKKILKHEHILYPRAISKIFIGL